MRNRLGRFALFCAGIVIAGHMMEEMAYAGKPFRSGPDAVRWRDGRLRLEISRTVHTGTGTGVAEEESTAGVHRAIVDAIGSWVEGVPGLEVEIAYTSETQLASGLNLITFTDPAPFDQGLCAANLYLACTILRFDELTGEIAGASVAFNPYKRHSATGLAGTHDMGLLMMHEMGHVLGLDHSAVLDSVMSPELELDPAVAPRAAFPLRQLSSDDRLTLAALYTARNPGEDPAGQLASIRGTVLRGGEPVAGAHVIAIDREGHPVYGAITSAAGAYDVIAPAGEYLLAVEPLDGPVVARQFVTVGAGAEAFPTLFWTVDGGTAEAREWIAADAESPRGGIDFALPPSVDVGTEVVNAATVGVVANGAYWGAARTQVAQNANYTLGITRNPADGPGEIAMLGVGWNLEGASSSPASAPQLLRQKLGVGSAPGAYVLAYRHEVGVSLLAGAVTVVPKPVAEAAAAADGLLVIQGSGLAALEARAREKFLDGGEPAPYPSQLGGVSVRAGGRWLPLRAVSPNEIAADAPAAGIDEVTVVTGTGVETTVGIAR